MIFQNWGNSKCYINNLVFFVDEQTLIASEFRPCAVYLRDEYDI
jgi:hypothetical protein